METDRDNISVRVASFAYYLDSSKESFSRGVSARENPVTNPEKTVLPSNAKPFSFPQGKNPKRDGEISVFGADKYFSMKLEYPTGQKHERPIDLIGVESKIKPRTPSLCSEASSTWNSQSALIPTNTVRRNESKTKKTKMPVGRRLFSGVLGCQGPCFDKKDVHVSDVVLIPSPVEKKVKSISGMEESRTSIEVFGSKEATENPNKGSSSADVAAKMERKLSMLTWDAIPVRKGQAFQAPTAANSTVFDGLDMASDASSDLFEIENISGTLYPMLTSSSSAAAAAEADDVSTCMSPAYAPSEDSIQWSVVTASAAAADYSSVLTEFNDDGRSCNRKLKPRSFVGGGKDSVMQKSKASGGILGCKNQKAVDVAESVCFEKARANEYKGLIATTPKSMYENPLLM